MKPLTLIFAFACLMAKGQYKADTVINTGVYTSYFSYTLHEPLYVVYKLYNGGGHASRAGMTFKTGGVKNSATAKDYSASGYDEGHMCNAEDFANDKAKEEKTFRFYNALPQTARSNRGIWKVWETKIRKESQTDSLLVICGGIFGTKTIGVAYVPGYTFKVVYSLKTAQLTHCLLFPNDNSDNVTETDLATLKAKLQFQLKY